MFAGDEKRVAVPTKSDKRAVCECGVVTVVRMERVVMVEFGPSRSKRFGKVVGEARSGGGECSELAPDRYRTRFVLGRAAGAYTGLARLLERVRHWRATEVLEGDEPSPPITLGRWPGVRPRSSNRSRNAASASTGASCRAVRSAPSSTPSGRSVTCWGRTGRRGWCLRSGSARGFGHCRVASCRRRALRNSTRIGSPPISRRKSGEGPPARNHQI